MGSNDSGILSRLDERSAWTLGWLSRIDGRLQEIDDRLQEGDERMDELTSRIASLETHRRSDPMPGLEKAVKILLPYAIGAGVLAITGSIEKALQVLTALGAK